MPKLPELERRFFNFEVRAEENGEGEKILTGRPVVYNSRTDLGWFDEVIESGALDGTDLTDVRFLVNHNTQMIPLARSRKNTINSTMHLTPDFEGLSLDWVKLDTENNSDSRSLYSAVSRGDISGMSFMFSIDSERWEDLESEHPVRFIEKIGSIVEISAVTFPAYPTTEINARCKQALDNARSAVETARQTQRAAAVETAAELALLKEKTIILGGN